jgi:hypothetical protein
MAGNNNRMTGNQTQISMTSNFERHGGQTLRPTRYIKNRFSYTLPLKQRMKTRKPLAFPRQSSHNLTQLRQQLLLKQFR